MKAPAFLSALPVDSLAFPATAQVLAHVHCHAGDLVSTEAEGGVTWHLRDQSPTAGTRLLITPTGHTIYYGSHGRRVLSTDPAGTVLHECEWAQERNGAGRLVRARVRLDSLLWIGLIPEATTHTTVLNLSHRADRHSMTIDDLRRMAAQAWRIPLEDIRYFFPNSSFEWSGPDSVQIHLKKDGLFLLEDGTFSHPAFISYMGAIPWARIDLLNVVELFQSTLPGTGSAVFELLWGLCDDQRQMHGPIALRYRGLPTYPSEPAYGLFSAFFRPEAPEGVHPHELFMDPQRASQITWWPRHDPPVRYFDRARRPAVTVQGGTVQKVTVVDDPVGVPYVAPGTRGGFASCQRTVVVEGHRLHLRDGWRIRQLALDPSWGVTSDTGPHQVATYPFGWRAFFDDHPPHLDPVRVHALALFYPDDETEVDELAAQPFVLEQTYASLNQFDNLPARCARITRVLIDGFDAVAAGCLDHDYTRSHTVLYRSPEWAQRQAQVLWDQAAQAGRLDAVRQTRFIPYELNQKFAYTQRHDLIYCWIPFTSYRDRAQCARLVSAVEAALVPGGLAFLVGPTGLRSAISSNALRLLEAASVEELDRLPLLREHKRLHPRTRLNEDLTVFLVEKIGEGSLSNPAAEPSESGRKVPRVEHHLDQ